MLAAKARVSGYRRAPMHRCAHDYFTDDVLACIFEITERTLAGLLVVCAKLVCTSAHSMDGHGSAFPVPVVGVDG